MSNTNYIPFGHIDDALDEWYRQGFASVVGIKNRDLYNVPCRPIPDLVVQGWGFVWRAYASAANRKRILVGIYDHIRSHPASPIKTGATTVPTYSLPGLSLDPKVEGAPVPGQTQPSFKVTWMRPKKKEWVPLHSQLRLLLPMGISDHFAYRSRCNAWAPAMAANVIAMLNSEIADYYTERKQYLPTTD